MAFVSVNMTKIRANLSFWTKLVERNGASLALVSKCCLSNAAILAALQDDISFVCDSNMSNFATLDASLRSSIHTGLIKSRLSDMRAIPSLSPQARPDRVYISDTALLDELSLLPPSLCPDIVLVCEIGDLKDGLYPHDIMPIVMCYQSLPIIGVSVNFACLSGRMPNYEDITMLFSLAQRIQNITQVALPFVSVGGTVLYDILQSGAISDLIHEVRIGEGVFFGYNSSGAQILEGLHTDAVLLQGEIIETAYKEIEGSADSGLTALGTPVKTRQTGRRLCAVLDFGILGAHEDDMIALDETIHIAGQTFDFTVVDITDSPIRYQVGDHIAFRLNYASASSVFMNRFISVSII